MGRTSAQTGASWVRFLCGKTIHPSVRFLNGLTGTLGLLGHRSMYSKKIEETAVAKEKESLER